MLIIIKKKLLKKFQKNQINILKNHLKLHLKLIKKKKKQINL